MLHVERSPDLLAKVAGREYFCKTSYAPETASCGGSGGGGSVGPGDNQAHRTVKRPAVSTLPLTPYEQDLKDRLDATIARRQREAREPLRRRQARKQARIVGGNELRTRLSPYKTARTHPCPRCRANADYDLRQFAADHKLDRPKIWRVCAGCGLTDSEQQRPLPKKSGPKIRPARSRTARLDARRQAQTQTFAQVVHLEACPGCGSARHIRRETFDRCCGCGRIVDHPPLVRREGHPDH